MVFTKHCVTCGRDAARVEVLSPQEFDELLRSWPEERRQGWERLKTPTSYFLISQTVGGSGHRIITAQEADRIQRALSEPLDLEALQATFYDRAGYCVECGEYYCGRHWSISATGYGRCPNGHGKSLDPHWSPGFD
jgi:hypothetical protein